VYVIAFSSAQDYQCYLNFDDNNEMPHDYFLKKFTYIGIFTIIFLIYLILWPVNFFHIPGYVYVLLGLHNISGLILFYKIANRVPE